MVQQWKHLFISLGRNLFNVYQKPDPFVFFLNHTHEKKLGHTSEFPFGIYWWTLENPKNQNFEKMKKIAGDIIYMCTKNRMQCTSHNFCHFRSFFALLPQYWPQKLKFGKNVRSTWRYYPFTHVHHKSCHSGPFFALWTL